MTSVLVDTNIFIDILGEAGPMRDWSSACLIALRKSRRLCVNQIIFAELAPILSFDHANLVLTTMQVKREELTYEASWRAGVAHAAYRRAGGTRERTLPDFLIGAHALLAGFSLLTRDAARYRSYFPELNIIAPDAHL